MPTKNSIEDLLASILANESKAIVRRAFVVITLSTLIVIIGSLIFDYSSKSTKLACKIEADRSLILGSRQIDGFLRPIKKKLEIAGHYSREYLISKVKVFNLPVSKLCAINVNHSIILSTSWLIIFLILALPTSLLQVFRLKILRKHDFSLNKLPFARATIGVAPFVLLLYGYWPIIIVLGGYLAIRMVGFDRTGSIPPKLSKLYDGRRFYKIQNIIRYLPDDSKRNLSALVAKINSSSTNDLEKVYAIYLWITENLTYDTLGVLDGSHGYTDAYKVFYGRKGSCHGYCELFSMLCENVGVRVRILSGESHSTFSSSGWMPHAWIAVRLSGDWYLCDPTWDSGSLNPSTLQFSRSSGKYKYFLKGKQDLRSTHRANDNELGVP